MRLAELLGLHGRKPTMAELLRAEDAIRNGYILADSSVHDDAMDLRDVLMDADAFVTYLRRLHSVVFGTLWFSGQFREGGDHSDIEFDTKAHMCRGSHASAIVDDLVRIHTNYIASVDWASAAKDSILAAASRVLVHLFKVHPFYDGNGRIGRLFIKFLIDSTRRYRLKAWPQRPRKFRRRYLWALRYAHSRLGHLHDGPQYGHVRHPDADPYGWMTVFISKMVIEDMDAEEALPPAWIPLG